MRLHKITLLNLNSLYGEQCLDLDRNLSGASLFLIHGRTGSGKSTLMDAVSLALFGKTPRLDDRRNSPDSDPCGIMSRGTGECRATVEFSRIGAEGRRIRFEADWKARRSRGRADGKFQPVERSLRRAQDDGSWELLISDKKKSVVELVFSDALDGFSVEDFQRSMLLAQGRFDELLNASPEERATILERLTDTKDYRRLGERAARLASAHNKNIDFLKRQMDGAEPVSESQATSVNEAAQGSAEKLSSCSVAVVRAREELAWWSERLRLKIQLEALAKEKKELDDARTKAEPLLQKAREHEACLKVFESVDRLTQLERRLLHSEEDHRIKSEQWRGAQEDTRRKGVVSQLAQEALTQMKQIVDELRIPCVALDTGLRDEVVRDEALSKLGLRLNDAEAGVEAATEEVAKVKTLAQKAQEECKDAELRLASHSKNVHLREVWGLELRENTIRLLGEEERCENEEAELSKREVELKAQALLHKSKAKEFEVLQKTQLMAPLAKVEEAKGAVASICAGEEARSYSLRLKSSVELAGPLVADTLLARNELWEQRELRLELALAETQEEEYGEQSALVAAKVGELRLSAQASKARSLDAETQASRLSLVAEIATRRVALKKGEPCPLCGSGEHPYLEKPGLCPDERALRQTLREAESERERRRAEAERASEVSGEGESQLAAAQVEQKNAASLSGSLRRKGRERLPRLRKALLKAQLPEACGAEQCKTTLLDRSEKLDEAKAKQEALALAMEQEVLAERNLALMQDEMQSRRTEHEKSALSLSEREKFLGEDQAKQARIQKELLVHQEQLQNKLLGLGVELVAAKGGSSSASLVVGGLDEWKNRVLERVDALERAERAYGQGQAQVLELEAKQASVVAELKRRDSLLDEVKRQSSAQKEALTVLRAELEEQSRRVRNAWARREANAWGEGGEPLEPSPRAFLRRLEALQTHQEARAMAAVNSAQVERGVEREIQGEVGSLAKQRDALIKEQSEEKPRLLSELSKLDLDSTESALTRRMELDAFRLAQEEGEGLHRRGEEYKTREEERQGAIVVHGTKMPSGFQLPVEGAEVAGEVAGEVLQGESGGQKSQTSYELALQKAFQIAEILESEAKEEQARDQIALADVRRRQREFKEAGSELQRAEEDAEVWLRLAGLIGKRDGKAFREFAQGLNLHRLIVKANVHLQRLSERYQLTQALKDGFATLDFAIRDLWQVGEPRSPRGLSGGERFLVSLALALGLSDLRSQSLPIETLLLDEGFGTLDPDTLDTALAALQHLQADGRQVGVISHVAGLKERIEAQVLIEEEGGGRSRISVASTLV